MQTELSFYWQIRAGDRMAYAPSAAMLYPGQCCRLVLWRLSLALWPHSDALKHLPDVPLRKRQVGMLEWAWVWLVVWT